MLCSLNTLPSSGIKNSAWKPVAKLRCGKGIGAICRPSLQCTQGEGGGWSNLHAAGGASPFALVHCLLHGLHGTAIRFSTTGATDV